MRRRAHLLATAALVATLAPIAASAIPTDDLVHRTHRIRDALIDTGSRFHGLADILTGAMPRADKLPF